MCVIEEPKESGVRFANLEPNKKLGVTRDGMHSLCLISRGFEPINVERLIRELLIVKRGGGYPVGGEPYFEGRASGAGFGVGGGISKLRDRHTSENSDLGRLVCSTRVKSCQPC